MDKVSTSASNANFSNLDGTTSFEPPICREPRAVSSCEGADGVDDAPARRDGLFDDPLRLGLVVGSKVSSGVGGGLRLAGRLASPASFATEAEAARLLPMANGLKVAGRAAGGVGAFLALGAGAEQLYVGHQQHRTKDEVFGALKMGAAVVSFVSPPAGLIAGGGIFVAELIANHLDASKAR